MSTGTELSTLLTTYLHNDADLTAANKLIYLNLAQKRIIRDAPTVLRKKQATLSLSVAGGREYSLAADFYQMQAMWVPSVGIKLFPSMPGEWIETVERLPSIPSGSPEAYIILGYDESIGTPAWRIKFDRIPDGDYTVYYWYNYFPAEITGSATPLLSTIGFDELLLWGATMIALQPKDPEGYASAHENYIENLEVFRNFRPAAPDYSPSFSDQFESTRTRVQVISGYDLTTALADTSNADSGDFLIGYKASGTGAVARTVHSRFTDLSVSVKDYGALGDGITDDTVAIQAACDSLSSTGGVVEFPSSTGYLVNTQITLSKPTILRIGDTNITGPATGYLFKFTANDSGIEGSSNTTLTATNGCSGVIHNNQTQRCHYWNFKIDPNNVANALIFNHDGGWYIDVKNVEILKSNTHSTTQSIYIKSSNTGVAGPTGSYGGAFVGIYTNVVAARIQMYGEIPNKVTTMTFINLDAENIIAENCVALTYLQPVMQQTGGISFDYTNVGGHYASGGDFEGTGTIYNFNGSSNRGIYSIGNQVSGFSGTYRTGNIPANGHFEDDYVTWDGSSPSIEGWQTVGSLPYWLLHSYTKTVKHRIGTTYDGDMAAWSNNLKMTAVDAGNLDDVAQGGTVLYMNPSGQFIVKIATSGANPRTLKDVAMIDYNGLHMLGGYVEGIEQTDPAAPDATHGILFYRQVGGKTELAVRFATGAVQQIAIQA